MEQSIELVGLFWHFREDALLGQCHKPRERAEDIRGHKTRPLSKRELQLKLFQPVKGQLPQELVDVGNAYSEAEIACFETGKKASSVREVKEQFEALKDPLSEESRVWDKAYNAWEKTGRAYDRALYVHRDEIEALHEQECLDCPWNGVTIFSAA